MPTMAVDPTRGRSVGRDRLCVFARVPALGKVKRRLVPALGETGALAAYLELAEGTLARCSESAVYRSELWLTSNGARHPTVVEWQARFAVSLHEQLGADLGERMLAALTADLAAARRAVVIGTDCPDIDRDYVESAFAGLDTHDVVLGPAHDGGYGLIGIRQPQPELFRDMPWGSDTVCSETLRRAAALGLSVLCLRPVYDVDRPEDWQRYRSLNPAPFRAIE